MPSERRKTRRTFNEAGHAHFLTFSCVNRWPLLSNDRTRAWLVEAIETARRRREFDLYAFVIMPEHVHLLVRPRQPRQSTGRFLYDVKRPVSWRAETWLRGNGQNE
ncbi:MAG: transposase, partial [Acidobacteria bacterium]|nr:transposase [Acidobacteriota bacterium]